jgi:hypothetical protein
MVRLDWRFGLRVGPTANVDLTCRPPRRRNSMRLRCVSSRPPMKRECKPWRQVDACTELSALLHRLRVFRSIATSFAQLAATSGVRRFHTSLQSHLTISRASAHLGARRKSWGGGRAGTFTANGIKASPISTRALITPTPNSAVPAQLMRYLGPHGDRYFAPGSGTHRSSAPGSRCQCYELVGEEYNAEPGSSSYLSRYIPRFPTRSTATDTVIT